MRRAWLLAGIAALSLAGSAAAQTTTVELVNQAELLSAGFRDGGSTGVRIRHERPRSVWYAGAAYESRFGDSGWSGHVALRQVLTGRLYVYAGASASTDIFFLPRYRVDGQLGWKFGAQERWVATASVMKSAAHDEHRDVGVGAGLVRYLNERWVVEAGLRLNRSTPGDVWAQRQLLAVTRSTPRRQSVTARVEFGEEAYHLTGANQVLVDFNSVEVGVRWDQWITSRAGLSVGAGYYSNPSYHRTLTSVGLFYQFGS